MFDNCIKDNDDRKIFTAEENGKKYSLDNESKFTIAKIQIDDCVFDKKEKKCDWLFRVGNNHFIFVELKGGDINKGMLQLYNTFVNVKQEMNDGKVWFRLSVGKNSTVPKSAKNKFL